MTGFDLNSLSGFDPANMQREMLRAMSSRTGDVQDPERARRVIPTEREIGPTGESTDFAGFLADQIENVQALHDDSRAKTRGLAMGEDVDLHDVMIASSKSEAAFNLMLEVRNKLVDAWEKLSRSVM
jgi:flagellar hook-basal body complex protein FliE